MVIGSAFSSLHFCLCFSWSWLSYHCSLPPCLGNFRPKTLSVWAPGASLILGCHHRTNESCLKNGMQELVTCFPSILSTSFFLSGCWFFGLVFHMPSPSLLLFLSLLLCFLSIQLSRLSLHPPSLDLFPPAPLSLYLSPSASMSLSLSLSLSLLLSLLLALLHS